MHTLGLQSYGHVYSMYVCLCFDQALREPLVTTLRRRVVSRVTWAFLDLLYL
jgi:hypothetical protein